MLQAKPEGPQQACFSFQNVSKCSANTCYALGAEGRHKQKTSLQPPVWRLPEEGPGLQHVNWERWTQGRSRCVRRS